VEGKKGAFFARMILPKDTAGGIMDIDLMSVFSESLQEVFSGNGVRSKSYKVDLMPIETDILEKLKLRYEMGKKCIDRMA